MFHLDHFCYPAYQKQVPHLAEWVQGFDFANQTIDFAHRVASSAVFSSQIEGNTVDLNSYLNWKYYQKTKPTKQIREINDLISAYQYAQDNPLTEKDLLKTHQILSAQFLIPIKRGKYRQEPMGIFGESGLVYVAVEPEKLAENMSLFWQELAILSQKKLSLSEAFYFTSLVHLRFVHLHPFADGNGRTARLLEKWFLANCLGKDFWKIPSEKYYYQHLSAYYQSLNLGVNFYELNYARSIDFLLLLPHSLKPN